MGARREDQDLARKVIGRSFRARVPADAPYYVTLDQIHQHLRPRGYVEIGVSRGLALALVLPGTRAIGIDPDPRLSFPLSRTTVVYRESSDDFFAHHDVGELLGGSPLDLAFIDGRHLFEFALRDFMNIELDAHRETIVLVHDCLPPDELSASRERQTDLWSGDVWKVIPILKRWRPDLRVNVIDVGPAGLGVVSGLDSGSRVLADNYEEIERSAAAMPYGLLADQGPDALLNRVPGDWSTIKALLAAGPFRPTPIHLLVAERAAWAWWSKLRGGGRDPVQPRSQRDSGGPGRQGPKWSAEDATGG
jgi:hypothetical protein